MGSDISAKRAGYSGLLLFVLGFSVFSVWLITVTFQLLLIDIAKTFQVQVGTAGLVGAVGSISGVVAGLVMAVLSVRFNHKLILLFGLVCTSLAAVAFFLAQDFVLLLAPNIGVGAGIALVTAMAYSLIGEFYPLEKRGRAIGCIVASTTMAFVLGAPVIGVIAAIGGWRSVMIWLSLPVALTCLVLAFLVIPNKSNQNLPTIKEPFFAGCKHVFSNRSATACLSVTMFALAGSAIGFYTVSFFRDQFEITVALGSAVIFVGNILASVGGVVGGFLVNRVGRKRLGTLTFLAAASITVTFPFMPTLTLAWGLSALGSWFGGMSSTATGSLLIEQVPKFRGTMMSLNTAFMNVGILLASVLGGLFLNLYNYQTMALILGSLGLVGAVIWVFLVRDPCKTKKN